ncbi:MAG: hypothetical protein SGILL_010166, partial [Bacillariaceae sp.]
MSMQEELWRKYAARDETATYDDRRIDGWGFDDDAVGLSWAGPGSHETKRRQEHNEELVKRVMDTVESPRAFSMYIGNLGKRAKPPNWEQRLGEFDQEYYGRKGRLDKEQQRVMQEFVSEQTSMEKLQQLKSTADEMEIFIQDVEQLWKRLGLYGVGIMPGYLLPVVCWKSMLQGQYESLMMKRDPDKKSSAVMEDCLETIDMGLQIIQFRPWGPEEDASMKMMKVFFLINRGRLMRNFGRFKEALQALRACRAQIQLIGPAWKRQPSIAEATNEFIGTLATMTVKVGLPRPHFSAAKREKWQKELGLSVFSRGEYKCGYCGVEKSEEQDLKSCNA